jgi:hypothetical protein
VKERREGRVKGRVLTAEDVPFVSHGGRNAERAE